MNMHILCHHMNNSFSFPYLYSPPLHPHSWMQDNIMTILDVFIKYDMPITVGVVTGEGDCYGDALNARFSEHSNLIEIASHSVTHNSMVGMAYADQLQELSNSKASLERLVSGAKVTLFVPPQNLWDNVTVQAMTDAGYTKMSAQCTVVQFGSPGIDNMCVSNMYPSQTTYFFPAISGIQHIPVGASITTFTASASLVDTAILFNGTDTQCWSDICSVASQLNAVKQFTQGKDWAVIMMHPQDFPASVTANTVEAYFKPIFAYAQQHFKVVRVGDVPANN